MAAAAAEMPMETPRMMELAVVVAAATAVAAVGAVVAQRLPILVVLEVAGGRPG